MSKKHNHKIADAVVESDEVALDAALAEIESTDGEIADTTLDAALADVATTESKLEAYESQPAEVAPTIIEPTDEVAPTAKVKKVRTPRASMASGLKASEVILSSVDNDTLAALLGDSTPVEAETVEAVLAKIDTLDKKSREKATNLFQSVKAGRKPSVYVVQTIEALTSEPLTLKGLTDYFLGRKYKIGTARRQASEMFALLPVVRIAVREPTRGSAMSLNVESALLKAIRPA